MDTPKTYVFFGNVGAGKGTQVELLKKALEEKTGKNVAFASPGNQYRQLVSSGNYTGTLVVEKLNAGMLQPDFLTNSVVIASLIGEMKEDSHILADGYPRSLNQSETLIEILKFFKRSHIEIVYIDVRKDEAVARMKLRARHDDTEEGIKKRFEEYENNVIPAMAYLEKEGCLLHTINGEQSVEDVHKDIIKALAL
jgi:adenylate kinase